MFLSKALVLISFVLYAHVFATPHIARPLHHRGISARLVAVENQPAQPRRLSKRCKPRGSLSQSDSSTSVPHTVASKTSSEVQPTPTSTPHTTYTPPPPPATTHVHTTAAPPPPPTTTYKAPPPPATTHSSGSGGNEPSFLIGLQTGQGTFYSTGLGACGITNNDGQYIAAVSYLLFDNFPGYDGVNPNTNPVCNRQVKVTYQGKTVTVTITDRCTGCALTSLDFSPAAFNDLADPSLGRLYGIEWEWV